MEGLYYLGSENKGADQLRGYREADLRLCFRLCQKAVFSRRGSNRYCLHERKVKTASKQTLIIKENPNMTTALELPVISYRGRELDRVTLAIRFCSVSKHSISCSVRMVTV